MKKYEQKDQRSAPNNLTTEEALLQLQKSRDQLRSILDTTLVQLSIMEAIRDPNGQITDLLIKETNKELEKETGRTDLVGKLYAEEYPGIKTSGLFDLIIKAIETGEPQQTEYFYEYEGFNKWYSCMFVKLGDGVVATNMDITPRKQAEEKLRKMEADQQREIFKVSLTTLEEERQRIAESLHNGIGQILYGAKISLGGLKQELTEKEFDNTKRYTNELLTEAIKETRRVSHELTPATLNEFGLKAAIMHVCEQLQNGVRFSCKLTGATARLEKYMQLAVYRTVQELLLNVAKHAQATESVVEVVIQKDVVRINVSDNGRGMDASKGHKPGIGLASIKSKIELLKGTVKIQSSATEGTMVKVMIPLPER